MNKLFASSVLAASMITPNAYATLASNAVLDFDDGIGACQAGGTYPDCTDGLTTTYGGSYFSFDASTDGVLSEDERAIIANAGTGITLGVVQGVGEIDQTWSFWGYSGVHYTQGTGPTVVSASGNTASVDMTGWTMLWQLEPPTPVNVGEGSDATITCSIDCSVGDTFTLDYIAVVPEGGFTGVLYGLHLEGVIAAVPVPAAVWLFGSGLIGLFGFSYKKRESDVDDKCCVILPLHDLAINRVLRAYRPVALGSVE